MKSYKDIKMPNIVLECALGNDCTKGADGGIWKTPSVNQDLAMQLVEQHVKFAHQNVAAVPGAATLRAEKLVRPTVKVHDGVIEEEDWE